MDPDQPKITIGNGTWIIPDGFFTETADISISRSGASGSGAGPGTAYVVVGDSIATTSVVSAVPLSTVNVEFMIFNKETRTILIDWSRNNVPPVKNDPAEYLPLAYNLIDVLKSTYDKASHVIRVRIISVQTSRIVDMIQ